PISVGGPDVPEPKELASVRLRELPIPGQSVEEVTEPEMAEADVDDSAVGEETQLAARPIYQCADEEGTVLQDIPCSAQKLAAPPETEWRNRS
ncbi:MAG TPA: hypothetical protein VLC08_12470, partial [Chitinolyticbacter sp.]|nr:hypothetical protein [Chitinolyticbacter sp.]